MRRWCDETVCLVEPESFWAVGQAYEDFGEVTDEQAVALLKAYAQAKPASVQNGQRADPKFDKNSPRPHEKTQALSIWQIRPIKSSTRTSN